MNTEQTRAEQTWTHDERVPYRIMVVEDEQLMRSIIVQLLRSEGYDVIEGNSADSALQVFEREKIDLAILDLNLGEGGSGLELLGKIHDLDPDRKSVV